MRLSTKLKISFGFLIFLPILLFIVAVYGVLTFNIRHLKNTYHIDNIGYDTMVNPIKLAGEICKEEYDIVYDVINNNVTEIHNMDFINRINDNLIEKNAALLIIENNNVIFSGKKEFTEEMITDIKGIEYKSNNNDQGVYLGGHNVMINGIHYEIGNDSGTVYFVVNFKKISPQMKRFIVDTLIAIILVLIITSAFFTGWIYKSTVKPINRLREATDNIKEGNLEFEMDVNGNNEFAELYKDFDNMRKRLKYDAEEKIRKDAENKEIISNIAHDLKTPITSIKGYVEGIMDGVADTDEKMDRYIKTIYNKASLLDSLLNELTLYAKVNSGKLTYNFISLNLTDYFDDCVEELKPELSEKNVKLDYVNNLMPETCIVADPEQLKKVINNIIDNSVKYMDIQDGIITIELYEEKCEIFIEISDNGVGISPEDLGHVFDRFYRSDKSRNSEKSGSGIGLSIVKRIIMDHGGSIEASSVPNEKTTMKITFDKCKKGQCK